MWFPLTRFFSAKPDIFSDLLSTQEPILLTAEKIPDEIYWQRCCQDLLTSYDSARLVWPHFGAEFIFVFCFQKIYDLLCEKKYIYRDRKKLLKFEAEGQIFGKNFEITRTIYSNSERSKTFLVKLVFSKKATKIDEIFTFNIAQFLHSYTEASSKSLKNIKLI